VSGAYLKCVELYVGIPVREALDDGLNRIFWPVYRFFDQQVPECTYGLGGVHRMSRPLFSPSAVGKRTPCPQSRLCQRRPIRPEQSVKQALNKHCGLRRQSDAKQRATPATTTAPIHQQTEDKGKMVGAPTYKNILPVLARQILIRCLDCSTHARLACFFFSVSAPASKKALRLLGSCGMMHIA
jgi:hypothetical protein